MFEFRMANHLLDANQSRKVVEVWKDGEFKATIYPTEKGIKVVSKYFPLEPNRPEKVKEERVEVDCNGLLTTILIDLVPRESKKRGVP